MEIGNGDGTSRKAIPTRRRWTSSRDEQLERQSSPGWERSAGSPGGLKLVQQLNNIFTRQFRIGCMFDQSPLAENRVTLDLDKNRKPNNVDGLGLPRPKVEYGLDPYTMEGFRMAPTSARRSTSDGGDGVHHERSRRHRDFTYKGRTTTTTARAT